MNRLSKGMVVAGLVLSWAMTAAGDPPKPTPPAAPARLMILGPKTVWRYDMAFKTPAIVTSQGEVTVSSTGKPPTPMNSYQTPAVPAGWQAPAFEDATWARWAGLIESPADWNQPLASHAAYTLCARGKFWVDDPAAVKDLRLTIAYSGGAIVTVNGKEVARGHLPAGELGPDTLAERYPDDVFIDAEGFLTSNDKKEGERLARRIRTQADIAIPATALCKGLNVMAVEARRAPLSQAVLTAKRRPNSRDAILPHVGMIRCELTAAPETPATAIRPNAGVLTGSTVQVWTPGRADTISTTDTGEPGDPQPIRVLAVRNGTFSGRLAVSSGSEIRNLSAKMSDLASAKGKLTGAAVRVRFAEPGSPSKGETGPGRFDLLVDAPPAGAKVMPIWVTVRTAADTPPGDYRGELTVQAEGLAAVTVPVEVKVHDVALPDAKDFVQCYVFYPSHESVATYYKVPFWSERHFELMGQGMKLLNELGCRFALVPLVRGYYTMSNSESMLRLVQGEKGDLTPDFTIIEKYLDMVDKAVGKPRILRLNLADRNAVSRYSPTVVNAKGEIIPFNAPPSSQPEYANFWGPALTQLRERITKRGWQDVTAFGCTSYTHAMAPVSVDMINTFWPGFRGLNTSHSSITRWPGAKGPVTPVVYTSGVWDVGSLYNPDAPRRAGAAYPTPWKRMPATIDMTFPREGCGNIDILRSNFGLSHFRMVAESAIQGDECGLDNMGADFWPLVSDKGRPYRLISDACTQLSVGATIGAILSPGPNGPTANERFEILREGIQTVELIVLLQKAAEAGKLGPGGDKALAALLNERARAYRATHRGMWQPTILWSFIEGAAATDRDRRLMELGAQIAK